MGRRVRRASARPVPRDDYSEHRFNEGHNPFMGKKSLKPASQRTPAASDGHAVASRPVEPPSAKHSVHWLDAPEEHDYPAAASYLSLVCSPVQVTALIEALRAASVTTFLAKDILRASRLPLLEEDNKHVASDLAKVRGDAALSPILLVRGSATANRALQIADGYHRMCASYHTDENTAIPCLVVDLPD